MASSVNVYGADSGEFWYVLARQLIPGHAYHSERGGHEFWPVRIRVRGVFTGCLGPEATITVFTAQSTACTSWNVPVWKSIRWILVVVHTDSRTHHSERSRKFCAVRIRDGSIRWTRELNKFWRGKYTIYHTDNSGEFWYVLADWSKDTSTWD